MQTLNQLTALVCLALALVLVPAAFVWLCVRMVKRRVHWLCYPAYIFLFGAVGGFCLAVGLSPSPIGGMLSVLVMVTTPLPCLCSSVALQFLRNRGRFEKVAMMLGYCYVGFFAVAIGSVWLFHN